MRKIPHDIVDIEIQVGDGRQGSGAFEHTIAAARGSFSLFGHDAVLIYRRDAVQYTFDAEQGDFLVTGQPLAIGRHQAEVLLGGSFVFMAAPIALGKGTEVILEGGTITIVGDPAGIAKHLRVGYGVGQFLLAGGTLELVYEPSVNLARWRGVSATWMGERTTWRLGA